MKTRFDFVTNSSSSSFVISRDHVDREKLNHILLEIANLEGKEWGCEYTEEVIREDGVTHRYNITEATPEQPYSDYYDKEYTNHYIIDNDSCVRYDWDAIEEVLDKHNIPFVYGYCD